MSNKLMIAAAGSGKTTLIVIEALAQCAGNVLITTYTQANAEEIIKKIISLNRAVPPYITVQPWFSFLLQHGVKPYQGSLFKGKIKGLLLVNEQSGYTITNKGKVYFSESGQFSRHYFTGSQKIFSDKLSKFVVRTNEKSNGAVINRLKRIYTHIFVDEVQDLAGYDLEVLKLLFSTDSEILLVGDPRQVTYLTHHEKLHSGYKNGAIKKFISDKKLDCLIDETTLQKSHRNNQIICNFSSRLFPDLPASMPCQDTACRAAPPGHSGIFLVRAIDVPAYSKIYLPTVLRYNNAIEQEFNFGMSKGLGFDRVLIYPTAAIVKFLKDGKLSKKVKGKEQPAFNLAKFYVALTRARYSVAIVCDFKNEVYLPEITKWNVISSEQMTLF